MKLVLFILNVLLMGFSPNSALDSLIYVVKKRTTAMNRALRTAVGVATKILDQIVDMYLQRHLN